MGKLGNWIKGSGSYEVKEIAGISEKGELVTNGDFATDSDWVKQTGWTISGGKAVATSVENTKYIVQTGVLTDADYYICRFTIEDYVEGSITVQFHGNLFVGFNSNDTYTIIGKAIGGANLLFRAVGTTTLKIDNVSVQEVPEGYPLLDAGTKYLECTSNGTIALPSTQAYGTWEFDLYKGTGTIYSKFISNINAPDVSGDSYMIYISSTQQIGLRKVGTGGNAFLNLSAASYISNNTWYRVRITRTKDGEFYLYIKGGAFGNVWTLVSVTGGSGTNPVTDNAYTESKYMVLDLDDGDKIANIKVWNDVRQD